MEEDAAAKVPVTRLRRRLSVEHLEESNSPTPLTPTKKRGRLAAKPQLDLIEENGDPADTPNKKNTRKSISRDADKTLTPSRRSTRIRSNTSLVQDVDEDEKLTPSRRRGVRSNSSLLTEIAPPALNSPRAKRATRRASLLESDTEAPLTPTKSRRARNDSASNVDMQATPVKTEEVKAAKIKRGRANTSKLESDTEAPLTPTKSRRARNDSVSNVDMQASPVKTEEVKAAKIKRGRANTSKLEDDTSSGLNAVIENITEEEKKDRKSLSKEEDSSAQNTQSDSLSQQISKKSMPPSPNTVRKSPRLSLKKSDELSPTNNSEKINTSLQNKSNPAVEPFHAEETNVPTTEQPDGIIMTKTDVTELSVSNANLISNLDKKPKRPAGINKSTSAIDSKNTRGNRYRTHSFTTFAVDSNTPSEDLFYSDNEKNKKKKRKNLAPESQNNESQQSSVMNLFPEKPLSEKKKNKTSNDSIIADFTTETKQLNRTIEELGLSKPADTSTDSNNEKHTKVPNTVSNAVKNLFETNPATSIQSLEIIEDSDSGDVKKVTDEIQTTEDQCVPVVTVNSHSVPTLFSMQSCEDERPDDRSIEPMDIDETMPTNISLTDFTPNRSRNSSMSIADKSNTSDKISKRKSSISHTSLKDLSVSETNSPKKADKSPRKSSISKDTDKSVIENTSLKVTDKSDTGDNISKRKSSTSNISLKDVANKSTLVLSELNVSSVSEIKPSKKADKLPRKSSISKDTDKSAIENTSLKVTDKSDTGDNISKRKSYTSNISLKDVANKSTLVLSELNVSSETNLSKKADKSPRKSSISKDLDKPAIENTSLKVADKSSRKSSISKDKSAIENTSLRVDSSKSLRKSSISKELDRSENQDKSSVTAVTKDVSIHENSMTKLMMNAVADINPKKNTIMQCLTSTPVQDRAAKKSLQINTSSTAITPILGNKIAKSKKILSKSKSPTVGESYESDQDSEDSDSENSSKNTNYMIDDEAVDAGDDYQSGDSQDDEEREYERDNEIVGKGETLTSGDDVSGDSDYEKDSFIVSSDPEDEDLLSGSGDDLDMSDNELTMSKMSKKKFDDRKKKEQKSASREMYEARHQLSPSKDNKKNSGRLRIDSSLLESGDDDNKVPPKKNKRMRIESETSGVKCDLEKSSTKNTSITDPDIGYKKKKSKRLSESCNESSLTENEMTLFAEIENCLENDPLVVKIKPEPITPRKDFNISTVYFTDREELEQVEVQENVTMLKSNETSDPLQATFDDSDDDESLSENEEAIKHYESILDNLNNEHKLPIKSRDASLNFVKDKTQIVKERLMDELNITTIKKYSSKNEKADQNSQNSECRTNKVICTDESSSESIDLKLLFSDESNDGDKGGSNNNNDIQPKTPEKIILLKKCDGKTNLLANADEVETEEHNTSKKIKKTKKPTSILADDAAVADADSENLPFFIDTVGTYGNITEETPLTSATINKHKKNRTSSNSSVSDNHKKTTSFVEIEEDAVDYSLFNISIKKNKRNVTEVASDDNKANISQTKSKKKKKTFSENSADESQYNSKKNKHKKNDHYDKSYVQEDVLSDVSINSKSKKNKIFDEATPANNLSFKSKKNKKVESSIEINSDSDAPVEISSKKNKSLVDENQTGSVEATSSIKKSKKLETSNLDDVTVNTSMDTSFKKKSKKSKLRDEDTVDNSSARSHKKNKKGSDKLALQLLESTMAIMESQPTKTKKRKRNSSEVVEEENYVAENHTKKSKRVDPIDAGDEQEIVSEKHSKKKNKHKETLAIEQTIEPQEVSGQNKKRKIRNEDIGGKKSKIMKQNSLGEIHVPRLPDTLLNQLDDIPRQDILESKKSQIVSTAEFNVEPTTRRKNKPSEYLDQSIHLNHYKSPVAKKHKPKNVPKTLPFIPVASTSDKGFTTNFQVKVLPGKMEFVAKAEKNSNFKTDYLLDRRNKKLRTYDLYKKHRNMKLSKF